MQLEPGETIGDYEIVRHVTSGGMADLYLARRVGAAGFEKPVAIKLVHESLTADDGFVRMFLDEAHLSSQIVHPNVVHVEELREVDGRFFMVMEYVDGLSLARLLKSLAQAEAIFDPPLAVWIAVQIAEGLHAAHELRGPNMQLLNVVHRDVSPQNILIRRDGHIKVIDFGIAKSRLRSQQTRAGVLRGKLQYMSPEQARGRPLDRRADIYALGVLLWEMLTLRRLFAGSDERELIRRVQAPSIKVPSTFADISGQLDRAVMKSLAVDRDARFATALEFRKALLHACPAAATVHAGAVADLVGSLQGDAEPVGQATASMRSARAATAPAATQATSRRPIGQPPAIAPAQNESPSDGQTWTARRPARSAAEAAPIRLTTATSSPDLRLEGPAVNTPAPTPAASSAPPSNFVVPPKKRPLLASLLLFMIAGLIGAAFYFLVSARL